MLLALFSLSACFDQQPPLPEKIEGMWELHEIETTQGVVDGRKQILDQYPNCLWGRSIWTFDADHIQAGLDLLCSADRDPPPQDSPDKRASERNYYGCQVSVRIPASWDTEAGSWKVEDTVVASSRTRGLDADAIGVPTSCSVTLPAGEYQLARVARKPWRWEMLTPAVAPTNGGLFRLKLPDSDRPDFVAALKSSLSPTELSPEGSP